MSSFLTGYPDEITFASPASAGREAARARGLLCKPSDRRDCQVKVVVSLFIAMHDLRVLSHTHPVLPDRQDLLASGVQPLIASE